MDVEKRIRALREEIRYHSRKYYDENTNEISDFEYDALMRELKSLCLLYTSLRALCDSEHEVCGVVTQPDKRQGRKMELKFPAVKEFALSRELPVYQPERLKDGALNPILEKLRPALLVVIAYGRILPEDVYKRQVHCIFTASSISLSLGWRQPGHHYAIRAGRNLPCLLYTSETLQNGLCNQ